MYLLFERLYIKKKNDIWDNNNKSREQNEYKELQSRNHLYFFRNSIVSYVVQVWIKRTHEHNHVYLFLWKGKIVSFT